MFWKRAPWDHDAERNVEESLRVAVRALTSVALRGRLAIDPERDLPWHRLEHLACVLHGDRDSRAWFRIGPQDKLTRRPRLIGHPLIDRLPYLVVRGAEEEAVVEDVPLDRIKGMSAMNHGSRFNLFRAPESMVMGIGETWGPLSLEEFDKLEASIRTYLGAYEDGHLNLAYQAWDGSYIVRNTGSARRFALWYRLQRSEAVPAGKRVTSVRARVVRHGLDPEAVALLSDRFDLYFICPDPQIEALATASALAELDVAYLAEERAYGDRTAALILPRMQPDWSPEVNRQVVSLEQWARGCPSLGRYFMECEAARDAAPVLE